MFLHNALIKMFQTNVLRQLNDLRAKSRDSQELLEPNFHPIICLKKRIFF